MVTSQVQHIYAGKLCNASERQNLSHNALKEVNRVVSLTIEDKEITHGEYTMALSARQNYYNQIDAFEKKANLKRKKN